MPKAYRLPEGLRAQLAKPLGKLFRAEEVKSEKFERAVRDSAMLITVGDRVTETIGKMRAPDMQVVDSLENRKQRTLPDVPYARLVEADNPPGTLTHDAIMALREAFSGKKPVRVLVHGEEDLMAIPVIALAPISAVVFYGQPGEGIVMVVANSTSKTRNRAILNQMGIAEIR